MKSSSRVKVGGRKGDPGYRTQATFLGGLSHKQVKNVSKINIDKNKIKHYTKDSIE